MNYSPPEEAWPGWLFYAATHFEPSNPAFTDFAQLNQYVARCQSFLQTGKPDNDVLLYFPIYDRFSDSGSDEPDGQPNCGHGPEREKGQKLYNINVSARLKENLGEDSVFTAAKWSLKASGLVGSVTLVPIQRLNLSNKIEGHTK